MNQPKKIPIKVGVVGSTGLVGESLLDLLSNAWNHFEVKEIHLFASKNSVGKRVYFGNRSEVIKEMNLESLSQCQAVFFASDFQISKEWIPVLAKKGILCIDKSSAYRADPDVPLCVPEVNPHHILIEKLKNFPVIANPNCCATPLVLALKALSPLSALEALVVSTYQSVSGAGKPAMDVLREETQLLFRNGELSPAVGGVFPKPIAFNVMPFVAEILKSGDTDEELKIRQECAKILDWGDIKLDATSVRVPTFVGHALSVVVALKDPVAVPAAIEAIHGFPGLAYVPTSQTSDLPSEDRDTLLQASPFATPRDVAGGDIVLVSRMRKSNVFENGLNFWVVGDNLRKGAAQNAVQILDLCCQKGLFEVLGMSRYNG